ncbi:hypothetical protein G5B38_01570 [Pseudohalocynthiibacter aestuariivivens]|nr:hypothetical protein [Pseudohalocynthiibacter aestuariivivens]QIE44326.1 hypothetical protein G5B38_01570 [Pseudohalocynthiibacter aestuariivivens]
MATIPGSGSDDTLQGTNDTITAGSGNDSLSGGAQSDTFVITDGGNHTVVGGEDADGSDLDILDLSGCPRTSSIPVQSRVALNFWTAAGP